MNKIALANKIAEKVGVSKKEAEQMLDTMVDIIIESVNAGETVNLAGFGAFSARVRKGRIGVNPQNPSEQIEIPPVRVPKFKAGKTLKDALKGKKTTVQPQIPTPPTTVHSPTEPQQSVEEQPTYTPPIHPQQF